MVYLSLFEQQTSRSKQLRKVNKFTSFSDVWLELHSLFAVSSEVEAFLQFYLTPILPKQELQDKNVYLKHEKTK